MKKEDRFSSPSSFIFYSFASYEDVRDALNLYLMENKVTKKNNTTEIEFRDGSKTLLKDYEGYYGITCNCEESNNKHCKHELFTVSKVFDEPLITKHRAKSDSAYINFKDLYLILTSIHDEDFMYCGSNAGYTSDFSEAGIYTYVVAKGFPIIHSIKELAGRCAISLVDFVKEMVDLNMKYIMENIIKN